MRGHVSDLVVSWAAFAVLVLGPHFPTLGVQSCSKLTIEASKSKSLLLHLAVAAVALHTVALHRYAVHHSSAQVRDNRTLCTEILRCQLLR